MERHVSTLNAKPVDVYHINLVRTPGNEQYHRQERLFLSLQDTLSYIISHERSLAYKLRRDKRRIRNHSVEDNPADRTTESTDQG